MTYTCKAKTDRGSTRKQFIREVVGLAASPALAGRSTGSPKIAVIVAHPDDEYAFAATLYRITRELQGVVDQVVITNGEGGYRYAKLAETFYGVSLAREEAGRKRLPAIRREETLRAGKILGIRDHWFLDQKDARFTLDRDEAFSGIWNVEAVRRRLNSIVEDGGYDYVLVLLPTKETHGHHQAAALLALDAVRRLPAEIRPVVLAGDVSGDAVPLFESRSDVPQFRTSQSDPAFRVSRNEPIRDNPALTYNIIVNWVIAEHKSQGLFQTEYGKHSHENFWVFDKEAPRAEARARELFNRLSNQTRSRTAIAAH